MTDSRKVIIGNGDYARMMNRYLRLSGYESCAYAVEPECISDRYLDSIPVLSLAEMRQAFPPGSVQLIMGIGYRNMGNIRKKIWLWCREAGYTFTNYIHPTAIIEKNVMIGEGNNILEGVILEESVSIGNANLLFGGSLVAHGSVLGDFNTLSVRAVVAGCTSIENHCFIGAAAVVRDHITIENYGLVGAGAYASAPVKQYQVIVPPKAVSLENKKSIEFI